MKRSSLEFDLNSDGAEQQSNFVLKTIDLLISRLIHHKQKWNRTRILNVVYVVVQLMDIILIKYHVNLVKHFSDEMLFEIWLVLFNRCRSSLK